MFDWPAANSLAFRFIGRIVGNSTKNIRRAIPILKPMMDERRRMMEEFGEEWPDKPVRSVRMYRLKHASHVAVELILVLLWYHQERSNSMDHGRGALQEL